MTARPFTSQDFTARMTRAAREASAAGLSGLLITPGPDLVYFCGYQPSAITERLTALLLTQRQHPTMIVPRLEIPDARAAIGETVELTGWTDGSDPYGVLAAMLPSPGTYGISDSAWALHLLGLQRAKTGTHYAALSDAMPMLRAVKDADELERLAAAGASADARRSPRAACRSRRSPSPSPATRTASARSTLPGRSSSPPSWRRSSSRSARGRTGAGCRRKPLAAFYSR